MEFPYFDPPTPGYIYILQAGNRIKIGKMLNHRRLRIYQTESPYKVRVLCIVKVPDYDLIDFRLLEYFRKYRVKGREWFRLTPLTLEV